jgi:hypothetical protein
MSSDQGFRHSSAIGPAKEGIVLDPEGNVIAGAEGNFGGSSATGSRGNVHVIQGGWGLAALLGIGIPLFLVAGVFIVGILIAVFLLAWLMRILLGGGRTRGR